MGRGFTILPKSGPRSVTNEQEVSGTATLGGAREACPAGAHSPKRHDRHARRAHRHGERGGRRNRFPLLPRLPRPLPPKTQKIPRAAGTTSPKTSHTRRACPWAAPTTQPGRTCGCALRCATSTSSTHWSTADRRRFRRRIGNPVRRSPDHGVERPVVAPQPLPTVHDGQAGRRSAPLTVRPDGSAGISSSISVLRIVNASAAGEYVAGRVSSTYASRPTAVNRVGASAGSGSHAMSLSRQ